MQLTSADIAYAFDRYKNYDKSVHKTGLAFIDKIETPDATTVKITTKAPYADTVNYLGGNLGVYISPKELAETPDAATKMVGTGPFMLTDFKTGVSLSFKKHPDYFDKPYPYFDDVTTYITTDTAKRVADFSAKSVNLTWLFLPDERDQLKTASARRAKAKRRRASADTSISAPISRRSTTSASARRSAWVSTARRSARRSPRVKASRTSSTSSASPSPAR